MKTIHILSLVLFSLVFLASCTDDGFEESTVIGLWKQVTVTEDGSVMQLAPEQESCQLLIEANGVCRYYHQAFQEFNSGNGPTTFYGTWSMLEGQWINFTTDKWQFIPALTSDSSKVTLTYKTDTNGSSIIDTLASVKKQWSKYHTQSRFTILQLSDTEMEIRLKTFVGEKKYALLFAPQPTDFIEWGLASNGTVNYSPKLVTDDNYWTIRKEFQTLKTYVFKFEKVDY